MNANIKKMKECFYRMMYDRGKELDRTFKGGSREFGAVRIGEHRRGNEIRNFQSKFDSQIRGPSMESEASNHPYMMNLISNGDSKALRQHTNNRSENLEAKIEALRNLINRSQTSDEGMRNSIPYATFEDISEKFHDLKQDCAVNDFVLRFEILKNKILATGNWSLREEFLVHKFINGLKQDIREMVKKFSPCTLPQTIRLAKLQEGFSSIRSSNQKYVHRVELEQENIMSIDTSNSNVDKSWIVCDKEASDPAFVVVASKVEQEMVDSDGPNNSESPVMHEATREGGIEWLRCHPNPRRHLVLADAEDSTVWEWNADNWTSSDGSKVTCVLVKLDLNAKKVDWKQLGIEHIKVKRINEDFEDPFYYPSNPVQIPPKSELLLAAEIVISMVEVKGWLAFEWEVCLLGLISQDMCAAEMVVQWLRKGVG